MKFLMTHNPFYAISAALVLFGLHQAHATWANGNWALLGILGGYAALLALAGVALVRLASVWDDARSIVLIVLILMLATSVGFDAITVETPGAATPQLLVGLGLAIGLSELLMRGLRLRLPLLARLPFHAGLGLFFLYPIGMSMLVEDVHGGNKGDLALALYGWPVFCGLVGLTWLPAVRMGRELTARSETPWRWPHFPWVAFGLLGVAAGLRTWLFCNSYYTGADDPFAVYLLAPLLLAVGVLCLEGGARSGHRGLTAVALGAPALALLASFPGLGTPGSGRSELVLHVAESLAAPAWLAAGAAVVYYGLAWVRGLRLAEAGLVAAGLAFALIGRDTLSLRQVQPQQLPMLTLTGCYLMASLWWAPSAWRGLLGLACLAWGPAQAWMALEHGLLLATLWVVATVTVGLAFRDRLAELLRWLAPWQLTGLLVGGLFFGGALAPGWPSWVLWPYCLVLTLAPLAFGRGWLVAAHLVLLGARLLVATVEMHRQPDLPAGVLALFWAGVFLVLALGVSLAKGTRGQPVSGAV